MPTENAVILLTPRWTEAPIDDPREEVLAVVRRGERGLDLTLSFPSKKKYRTVLGAPVRVGEMEGTPNQPGGMRRWGLEQLGPGVWKVSPSIVDEHVTLLLPTGPTTLHAFVILIDVPEPAPFLDS